MPPSSAAAGTSERSTNGSVSELASEPRDSLVRVARERRQRRRIDRARSDPIERAQRLEADIGGTVTEASNELTACGLDAEDAESTGGLGFYDG